MISYRFYCLLLLALVTACSSPGLRQEALVSDSVTEADVKARSKLEGCELIPYDGKRAICITQNNGLHGANACDALACQKAAGQAANIQRMTAWQSCVDRRTAINQQFASTTNDLDAFKKGPQYKGWSQSGKTAMKTLLDKIKAGTPGHNTALKNAKQALADCKKIVG